MLNLLDFIAQNPSISKMLMVEYDFIIKSKNYVQLIPRGTLKTQILNSTDTTQLK